MRRTDSIVALGTVLSLALLSACGGDAETEITASTGGTNFGQGGFTTPATGGVIATGGVSNVSTGGTFGGGANTGKGGSAGSSGAPAGGVGGASAGAGPGGANNKGGAGGTAGAGDKGGAAGEKGDKA